MSAIYVLTDPLTDEVYVGGSVGSGVPRLKQHWRWLTAGRHKNAKLQAAFSAAVAAGKEFDFELVQTGIGRKNLHHAEREWLEYYGTRAVYNKVKPQTRRARKRKWTKKRRAAKLSRLVEVANG